MVVGAQPWPGNGCSGTGGLMLVPAPEFRLRDQPRVMLLARPNARSQPVYTWYLPTYVALVKW